MAGGAHDEQAESFGCGWYMLRFDSSAIDELQVSIVVLRLK